MVAEHKPIHAHVVSPRVKQALVYPQQQQYPHEIHDEAGDSLLAHLHRLAPSVAKDFLPRPSIRDDVAFRLINDAYPEGEEESYIAISYVWYKVSRDTPKKLISLVGDLPFGWVQTVEQVPLPTTKGMFQAVLNERRAGEGLWFDQVCINQEDVIEKALAIGTMDSIYKNARIVVAALDDVSVTVEELQYLEQYYHKYVFSDLPLDQHPNRGMNPPVMQQYPWLRSFVERILSSMWFERAWCAHELRMGRSHVFLVPCSMEYGEDSAYTVVRLTGAFFVHIESLLRLVPDSLSYYDQGAVAVRESYPRPRPSLWRSLVPTIPEIFNMKAGGNPRLPEHMRRLDANRDKTSIVLNVTGIPLVLKPPSPLRRPAIKDECLRQLLLIGLAARDPVTLCTTGAPLQLHDGSISWLCKPTPLDQPSSYSVQPPAFPQTTNTITQGSDGRAEYIQLDLIFLDLPHRTQPNPNFPAIAQRAREFIELCIQYQVQSHTLWNLAQTSTHPRAPALRNIFLQTLACMFECGAAWLLDVVSQPSFPQSISSLDPAALELLFNPQVILRTYVNIPFSAALLHILGTFIAHGIPWASSASERTHGPLVVSAPSPSPPPPPRTFAHKTVPLPSEKLLLFAPFAHSKTFLVAVPAALKSPDYDALARGWILTPSSPFTGSGMRSPKAAAVSWVLRGKATVFGEGAVNAGLGDGGGESVRNHRVYGPGVGSA
ncbi:O-methyltransferase family 2 [Paraphaeosphaeria minitans]|uniref:O-methyltransferase family 2 n=1 Tax=Paraphaeosphaeria minitans TaxID=565426 RepID=A0A9P6GTU8_9PLEO|nr:O-methyltransferase family 2 [Paraphaeosphaeria minitans]